MSEEDKNKARDKYKNLSQEDKNKKKEYGKNRYHHMSEENKQKLRLSKKYRDAKKKVKHSFLLIICVFRSIINYKQDAYESQD